MYIQCEKKISHMPEKNTFVYLNVHFSLVFVTWLEIYSQWDKIERTKRTRTDVYSGKEIALLEWHSSVNKESVVVV